ncbi:Pimeloyl-ACP methyl ester carboxylesterase [Microlunatus sagamiharensis]|uniref:Pimeloyl-ACP methyl ester carboxylesterase n=1 Tax=Microlunatus sagamiharensis TaxID=546874 RepID=A0A1H2LP47_9ACTN|nr:alpha/beta hydrolase [Microlunatus sagamiharensis]SDU82787.1 Pimeloyl-ACP methyl ester carboxylesterase [Microlunatus sagamiharensis]
MNAADVVRTEGSHVTTLGGRQVHLEVAPGLGEDLGTPIMLVPGCAVPSYAFRPVRTAMPGRWFVAIDRPGMVETPWPGRLPTLAEEVATLLELCEALGQPPVVVAHSMAGPHVEALVRQHPGSVSGLVLLDASIELDAKPAPAALDRAWLAASRLALEGSRLPPFALAASLSTRVAVWSQSHRLPIDYDRPPGTDDLFRRPDTLASVVAEQAAYADQLADLQTLLETTTWPGTPSVVLTAGSRAAWVRKQRVLAHRVGGRQVVVERSRHLMMLDRPDVVAEAVLGLLPEDERGTTPA